MGHPGNTRRDVALHRAPRAQARFLYLCSTPPVQSYREGAIALTRAVFLTGLSRVSKPDPIEAPVYLYPCACKARLYALLTVQLQMFGESCHCCCAQSTKAVSVLRIVWWLVMLELLGTSWFTRRVANPPGLSQQQVLVDSAAEWLQDSIRSGQHDGTCPALLSSALMEHKEIIYRGGSLDFAVQVFLLGC